MNALPTKQDEAFRYADLAALGEVWDAVSQPDETKIAAQQKLQQIWLPSGEDVDVRRAIFHVGEGAQLSLFALNSAARYGRVELHVTLEQNARFDFAAANIGDGNANLQIVTRVHHVARDAVSRQTVRSVLGGKAVGSYLGKVAVARGADGTDGEQSVKAMLLDRGATANAKPELEIFADDVACAHGATVGELDANQLFYAAARGLDPATAKALLLDGFVGGLWDGLGEDHEIARLAREALHRVAR